jgi:hypothetical protein
VKSPRPPNPARRAARRNRPQCQALLVLGDLLAGASPGAPPPPWLLRTRSLLRLLSHPPAAGGAPSGSDCSSGSAGGGSCASATSVLQAPPRAAAPAAPCREQARQQWQLPPGVVPGAPPDLGGSGGGFAAGGGEGGGAAAPSELGWSPHAAAAAAAAGADVSLQGLQELLQRFVGQSGCLVRCGAGAEERRRAGRAQAASRPLAAAAGAARVRRAARARASIHAFPLCAPPPPRPPHAPARRAQDGAPDAARALERLGQLKEGVIEFSVLAATTDLSLLAEAALAPFAPAALGGGPPGPPPDEEQWVWAARQLQLSAGQVRARARAGHALSLGGRAAPAWLPARAGAASRACVPDRRRCGTAHPNAAAPLQAELTLTLLDIWAARISQQQAERRRLTAALAAASTHGGGAGSGGGEARPEAIGELLAALESTKATSTVTWLTTFLPGARAPRCVAAAAAARSNLHDTADAAARRAPPRR